MDSKVYHVFNAFRGMGALLVVFYHYFIFFFAEKEFCAWLIGTNTLISNAEPFYIKYISFVNAGHIGVTFFFITSGFLIIPSLKRHPTIASFIIHKFLRLWPTYATCLSMSVGFITIYHGLRGTESPLTYELYFSCFFWIRDLIDYTVIDVVVWVLEIQLKFYLCAVIGWHLIKKNFVEKFIFCVIIFSLSIFCLFDLYSNENSPWFYLVVLARTTLKFFMLFLEGICFYCYQTRQFSPTKTYLLCGILTGVFFSPLFHLSHFSYNFSYGLGTLIIGYFVFSRKLEVLPKGLGVRFLNRIASISYPSYLGHVIPGYVLTFLMIEAGYSISLGVGVSLIYVTLFSELTHKFVESPFIKLSKKSTDRNTNFKIIGEATWT
jgi:peptidoglycan/LPS O-acetylase OafA/YrhL